MRSFLTTAVCALFLSAATISLEEAEALQTSEEGMRTFTHSDVDGIVKFYSPDATDSAALVRTSEEIRSYLQNALMHNDYSAIALGDSAVVITGFDNVTGVRDEKPFSARGRITFVVAKRGPDWQITHFHRSTMPN
jgi:hypothetical protein